MKCPPWLNNSTNYIYHSMRTSSVCNLGVPTSLLLFSFNTKAIKMSTEMEIGGSLHEMLNKGVAYLVLVLCMSNNYM